LVITRKKRDRVLTERQDERTVIKIFPETDTLGNKQRGKEERIGWGKKGRKPESRKERGLLGEQKVQRM